MQKFVKIGYSIDIEEVPAKISGLMSGVEQTMGGCPKKLGEILKSVESAGERTDILKSIDKLRRTLYQIDLTLEDCYQILRGYHIELLKDQMGQEEENLPPLENENPSGLSFVPEYNEQLEARHDEKLVQDVNDKFQSQMDNLTAKVTAAQQNAANMQNEVMDQMPDMFKAGMADGQPEDAAATGKAAVMRSMMEKMLKGEIDMPNVPNPATPKNGKN